MSVVSVTFPGNITQVVTAPDLRGLPSFGLTNGQIAMVLDPAAQFSWDPSSSGVDNSRSILKPTDLSPLQLGRWVLFEGGGGGGETPNEGIWSPDYDINDNEGIWQL